MRWEKRGKIFEPAGQHGWMNSHAQVPTALVLPDRLRIYFASRPEQGLSLPGFVDVDRRNPAHIIALNSRPVLDVGRPGTFDADGVMPSYVVRDEDRVLLYYSGWCRLGGKAPYNNATGVAVSYDNGASFQRLFEGPILDRSPQEPWSATSPTVIEHAGGWHMWYSSGTDWLDVASKLEHVYVIKEATSRDGLQWNRTNRAPVRTNSSHESQTRPALLRADGKWHMWFSYRGNVGFRENGESYRLGYAHSDDLETWERNDEVAGITVTPGSWDAQMICYPNIVQVDDAVFMFYNGNGFGAHGFGYAVLQP